MYYRWNMEQEVWCEEQIHKSEGLSDTKTLHSSEYYEKGLTGDLALSQFPLFLPHDSTNDSANKENASEGKRKRK